MKVLFIGDIVGRPGRVAVKACLPLYRDSVDIVIANGENASGGVGITFETLDELLALGIDLITLGNHVWDKKEIFEFIADTDRVIRPLNYPGTPPGRGYTVLSTASGESLGVINACGRVFSTALLDDPFRAVDKAVAKIREQTKAIVVDFHAEATSEKAAIGHYLDGRVSAVLGTHTHVRTADAMILKGGTAYISDVGMTGPSDSVIGMRKDIIIQRFLTQLPSRFEVASGTWRFDAVLLDIEADSGRCLSINSFSHHEQTLGSPTP